ncbi:hypothetical protein RA27_00565 [Ruegeria sp. ANG-R]|uniref:STAS/SEC14 domain-containing protein n=1 Tax=Ruegeria sp. ANG-R TaxID=1577903 RepID=UPI00057FAA82|nr:STAS/SEC14 domain-containing protein [Ruegeria sp. ANG-R]KIC41942.1 hypothetical protein RA27_00565 [Ruegeria sp. ANG-R]
MITKLSRSAGPVLGFEISGEVTPEMAAHHREVIDAAIAEHGKISVLAHITKNVDFSVGTALHHISWALTHTAQFNKLAIVTDNQAVDFLVKEMDEHLAKFAAVDQKFFTYKEIEKAWAWVEE